MRVCDRCGEPAKWRVRIHALRGGLTPWDTAAHTEADACDTCADITGWAPPRIEPPDRPVTTEPNHPKVVDLLQALEDSITEAKAERKARQAKTEEQVTAQLSKESHEPQPEAGGHR